MNVNPVELPSDEDVNPATAYPVVSKLPADFEYVITPPALPPPSTSSL